MFNAYFCEINQLSSVIKAAEAAMQSVSDNSTKRKSDAVDGE